METKPYRGLDASKIREVLDRRYFPPGTTIFIEGEFGASSYIILKGEVSVIKGWETEHHYTVTTVGPGHFVGELALFNHHQRTATVYTEHGCELLEFSQDRFKEKLDKADPALKYWIEYLAHRLIDQTQEDGHFLPKEDMEHDEDNDANIAPKMYSHPAHFGHVIVKPKPHRLDNSFSKKIDEFKTEVTNARRVPRLKNVKSVKVSEIVSGQCLATDVLDHKHNLLAQAGTKVTDRIAHRLVALFDQGEIDTYVKVGESVDEVANK